MGDQVASTKPPSEDDGEQVVPLAGDPRPDASTKPRLAADGARGMIRRPMGHRRAPISRLPDHGLGARHDVEEFGCDLVLPPLTLVL